MRWQRSTVWTTACRSWSMTWATARLWQAGRSSQWTDSRLLSHYFDGIAYDPSNTSQADEWSFARQSEDVKRHYRRPDGGRSGHCLVPR